MIIACSCKWCGVRRRWQKCRDGELRPELSDGKHGVGHYPYLCTRSATGLCEVSSAGDLMVSDLASRSSRRMKRAR